jgi:hypothetical protein
LIKYKIIYHGFVGARSFPKKVVQGWYRIDVAYIPGGF